MNVAFDVLGERVRDRGVIERQRLVGGRIVCVDRRTWRGMLTHEPLQRGRVRGRDHRGCDVLCRTVLDADHRRLADRPAADIRQFLPLGAAHVPAATADVGFVRFDRASKQLPILRQGDPEPLRKKPRRFLCHTQVAVELHARHALETGHEQEGRDEPVLVADLRAFHHGTRLHAKFLRALLLPAAVGHRLVLAAGLHVHRPARGAAHAVRPSLLSKPLLGNLIVGEHPKDLLQRDPLPVGFPWCVLHHRNILQESGENVKQVSPLSDIIPFDLRNNAPVDGDVRPPNRAVLPVTGHADLRPTALTSAAIELLDHSRCSAAAETRPLWVRLARPARR